MDESCPEVQFRCSIAMSKRLHVSGKKLNLTAGALARKLVWLALTGFDGRDLRAIDRASSAMALFWGPGDYFASACNLLGPHCLALSCEARGQLIKAFARRVRDEADQQDTDNEWTNESTIDLDAILAEVVKD